MKNHTSRNTKEKNKKKNFETYGCCFYVTTSQAHTQNKTADFSLFCSSVCSFVFDDESAGLAAAIDPTGTKNRLSRSLSIQKRSFCQDTLGTDERKLVKRDTRFIYAGVFVTASDIVIDSITSESFGRRRRELQVSEES